MNAQTRKTRILFVAALLTAMALLSSACSFAVAPVGDLTQVVDVTIDQAQLNEPGRIHTNRMYGLYIPYHTGGPSGPYDRLLDEVTRVEVHDGFIRYTGYKLQADGSRAPASFDLTVGAENGMFKAQVTAVRIPGMTLSDPTIVAANRRVEAELSNLATDLQPDVEFQEVTAKEGALHMKIKVTVRF